MPLCEKVTKNLKRAQGMFPDPTEQWCIPELWCINSAEGEGVTLKKEHSLPSSLCWQVSQNHGTDEIIQQYIYCMDLIA